MTLLTVDELKKYPGLTGTTLEDDPLQDLLDAAEEAIIRAAGPTVDDYLVTSVTDYVTRVSGDLIMLSRRAASITEVTEHAQRETPTTLAADDYELLPSGTMLRRLRGGTNSSTYWHRDVAIEFAPYSDLASRKAAQAALVKLEINTNPSLAGYTTGSDSETYATGIPYAQQKGDILSGLVESADGGIW